MLFRSVVYRYIWQQEVWPNFTFNHERLFGLLAETSRAQGVLLGKIESLGFELRNEACLQTITEDVVKSSEIEGENLPRDQVRSSIARRLGIDTGGLISVGRDVEGIVEMMLDATGNFSQPLDEERLFAWHAALFPTGRSGMHKIIVGNWRNGDTGPMQVVSGPIGHEKVHFEAPPADSVPDEMAALIRWFESTGDLDPLLVSAITHLWFVTIHPFEDGNGRIARALADMALSRSEKTGQRFYSMSSQIRKEHQHYYELLEQTQKGELDITEWIVWFLQCLQRAIFTSEELLDSVLQKAAFWERYSSSTFNARQVKVLNLLLGDFEGKLTTSKWGKIAKCSQDTAHRDITDLIDKGALQKNPGGGRNTSYSLVLTCK